MRNIFLLLIFFLFMSGCAVNNTSDNGGTNGGTNGGENPPALPPVLPEYFVSFELNMNPKLSNSFPYTFECGTTRPANFEKPYIYSDGGKYYIGSASELKTNDNLADINYIEIGFDPTTLNNDKTIEATIGYHGGGYKTTWWSTNGVIHINTVTDEYITGTFEDVILDNYQGGWHINIALSAGKFKVKNFLPK